MFLVEKQIIKSKEVNLVQLESLLDALVKETDTLTESQIEDVTYIQDGIKQNNKLVLSEDASIKYQEFIEKVVLFDDSLQEGIIQASLTGINEDKYKELEDKVINGITTEEDKQNTLNDIDKLVDDSNRIFTTATKKEGLALIGLRILSKYAALIYLLRVIGRSGNTIERKEFKDKLTALRSKVESVKVKETK